MRKKASELVSVRAMSSAHLLCMALKVKEADAKGLMGFAIQCHDLNESETIWGRGNKQDIWKDLLVRGHLGNDRS